MTTAKAITARIPHLCDTCHFEPGLRGVATIDPGHCYLRHVAFPGDDGNESSRVVVLTECVAHVWERDPHAALDTGACSSYCCGVTPCARPIRHDGDCSCRSCGPRSKGLAA